MKEWKHWKTAPSNKEVLIAFWLENHWWDVRIGTIWTLENEPYFSISNSPYPYYAWGEDKLERLGVCWMDIPEPPFGWKSGPDWKK